MPARLTDRAPVSTLEKLTAQMSKVVNESAVLKPVSGGVNKMARKLIFRALQHIQFGSLTLIESFGNEAPKTSCFGSESTTITVVLQWVVTLYMSP